ncbi:tumor necrosis factor receptor type 1-associated DEATH domain protein [Tachyglossus aculeatus]|uniref:tumor necrosis factor receptor type 1-associated DEATH domain protein n=1 Tax=Tachyglossus aculeatus TaxID=9261 RepID=UPI0018F55771|nr:tumor necrosis factor receptor type 1-associated DEATH domain protein [Tachyglossus aculeatus]
MATDCGVWIGSVYLFVQSTRKEVVLSAVYASPQKPSVFGALKLSLAEATGNQPGLEVLKIHCSEPQLIVQLKFCQQECCRRFLCSYREGTLHGALQSHLQPVLGCSPGPLLLELKVGSEQLDGLMQEEERCLELIYREKPDRLRDEEIADLEDALRNLTCRQEGKEATPSLGEWEPNPTTGGKPPAAPTTEDTFVFQGQHVANRPLSLEDQQRFARLVGKKWKKVGRSLQRSCRALRDPVIDALAYEYEREGLYEQAYQLLLHFVRAEGRRATLQRLVEALEENSLTSLAEDLLGLQHQESEIS